jgi:hypothetical protein
VVLLVLGVLAVGCGLVAAPGLLHSAPQPQHISGALVSADGRHVTVPAQIGGCSQGELSAAQSPHKVVLSLSERHTGVVPCAEVVALGTATAVLRHPLSGRVLIDAATGRPVRYFDGRDLDVVGYLPAGYRPSGDIGLTFSSGRTGDSWTRVYTGPNPERLEVIQARPGSQLLVSYPVTQHTVVNGHQAAIGEDTENGRVASRAITWSAEGYAFAVVSEAFGRTSLPVSELLHVARSVQH